MSEECKKRQEQEDRERELRKRPYESPTLLDEEVFERAVYAACKLSPMPPQFCNPPAPSS
jgi:hypothetical protein